MARVWQTRREQSSDLSLSLNRILLRKKKEISALFINSVVANTAVGNKYKLLFVVL